ncbi:hypothetical protein EHS25_007853 [Saitozyma podzolica]|uniref:Uncharacterized protein n=1 Tax=Saitozyma podzolica TaxID=1890683 RepID=A0A427YR02_9TREE|nr:hypothetical protein EHS25_007853 [Saitozyma podzolica]
MSAPQPVQPSYLGPAGRPEPPSAWDFLKQQVVGEEYRESNLNILKATAFFALGIVFVRSSLGGALVPVF